MKKIASLILAGAMLLSGFLMPMQVKAESIVVNANNVITIQVNKYNLFFALQEV